MISNLSLFSFVLVQAAVVMAGQGAGRQNLMRLARDDKAHPRHDFSGSEVIRTLVATRSLDKLSGGDVVKVLDPLTGGRMRRALDRLASSPSLGSYRADEVLAVLDRLTGGELTSSLDGVDGVAVLSSLEKVRESRTMPLRKRTLDTLTGMAFGTSKRFDSLSGSTFGLSKRNFDEIDNVGFTGFSKRGLGERGRTTTLALAKKNFDEIDRAGFEGYDKRNFDEIDRAGFETFEKREAKE